MHPFHICNTLGAFNRINTVTYNDSFFFFFARYRDGVEIQPDDRHQIDMRGNFASLIMNDITADDDAEYSVAAVNKAGKATSKAELFVNPLSK